MVIRALAIVLALATSQEQLSSTLSALSGMYQQQAELRTRVIPTILTPILLMIIAVLIGLVLVSLFMPLISFSTACELFTLSENTSTITCAGTRHCRC